MPSPSQRILGLDPGLTATGYAVIDAAKPRAAPLALGDVRTRARDPLGKRLATIHDKIALVVERHRPTAVAAEALFSRVNVKTALLMAQARGVALMAACSGGADLFEYAPAEIKRLVAGSGRADKAQMMTMIRALVTIHRKRLSDHMADALATAICHCQHLQMAVDGRPLQRRGSHRSLRRQWEEYVVTRDS